MSQGLPEWVDGTVAVLSTVDRGAPHAIPISTAVRAGPRCVLMALARDGGTLARLRDDPRVALTVLTAGNVAVTMYGRAAVVVEVLDVAERVAAVRLAVERIHDHGGPESEIVEGVRWHWLDRAALDADARVHATLRTMASSLTE